MSDEKNQSFAEVIVEDVISELIGRSGFDYFWDDVEPLIQEEIVASLTALVQQRLDRDVGGVKGVKYMDVGEFGRLGFLQEANRLFFHPHGLALEITCKTSDDDEYSDAVLTGIWDYRDDPEGMLFGTVDPLKVERVRSQRRFHREVRRKLFASDDDVQPIDWKPPEEDAGVDG